MSQTETVEIDIQLVEKLIEEETAALDAKHARSLSYREEAKAHLPGGVSSSWQTWPPHPIYVDRGQGLARLGHRPERVRRLPQRLRRDGDGPRPPEDRRGRAEARRPRHALRAADRGRALRGREPRRAHGPAVLAVRQLGDRGDAGRGAHHARHHRAPADPEDRGHLPRPPRRPDGERLPVQGGRRPAGAAELRAADARHDPGHRRHRAERPVQRRRRGRAGVRRARPEDRRHDRRADHDELRRRAARPGLPPAPEGDLPRERRDVRLRRGQDRLHGRRGAARSRRSACSPTSWPTRRRSAPASRAARSAGPRRPWAW